MIHLSTIARQLQARRVCTLLVMVGLLACSRSQPEQRAPAVSAEPTAAKPPATPVKPAAAPALQSPLAADLKTARGTAICDLAARIKLPRDAALLGPALDLAFEFRRDEQARECTFKLLKGLDANESLPSLAGATTESDRWMAIVYHANRNLRARHFDVYDLALKSPFGRVHHAVAGGLGAYGPVPEAIALLDRAIDHDNENVRLKAARSLIEIGGDDAREILRRRSKVEKDKAVIVTIHRALKTP